MLNQLQLLQEKPEARNHEAESHKRQAGANPGEESSLRSQQVA